MISLELEMKQKLIGGLAILTVLCGYIARTLVGKYVIIPDNGESWVEKCLFIYFIMILIGILTIFEWDNLFLDTKDQTNLTPLPLKAGTIVSAKFTSLFLFVGMFTLAINSMSTVVFSFYLLIQKTKSMIEGFRFILAHLISCITACLFVFFVFLFFVGLLSVILRNRLFKRISIFIRAALMSFLLFQMILFFAARNPILGISFEMFDLENPSLLQRIMPPMWFTGFYETLLGNTEPFFIEMRMYAVWGLTISIFLFSTLIFLNRRKFLKATPAAKPMEIKTSGIGNFIKDKFNNFFLKNQTQRAIFYFFKNTIVRNKFHKMQILALSALSLGLGIIMMAYLSTTDQVFSQINKTMLGIPIIIIPIFLLGIKYTVSFPERLEGNWIFRITENKEIRHYSTGFKKGIVFLFVLPLLFLFFLFYFFYWGWQPAFLHCLFVFGLSLILIEIFFWNYNKIPFTCSYLPGKAKMHYFWVVYFLGFLSFGTGLSHLAFNLLKNPVNYLYFSGVGIVFLSGMKLYTRRLSPNKIELKYEENPEPAVISLTVQN
jgi:hypothetical protein